MLGAPVLQGRLDYAQCERVWGSGDWPERIAGWFLRNGVPPDVTEDLIESGHVFADFVRFAWNPTLVDPGDEIAGWQVLATPGHADGHLCLYRDGVLVAGDHVLTPITPAIGLYPESRPDPLGDYVGALADVAALAPRIAFPGHRDPIVDVPGPRRRDRRPPRRAARPDRGGARRRAAPRLRRLARPVRAGARADPAPVRRRGDALAPRAARRPRPRGPLGRRPDRYLYCARSWWTTSRLVPAPRRWGRDTPLRARRRRGPDPPQRVLRRGRVRARDRAPDADRRAAPPGEPPRARRAAHHRRPGPLHRGDAARRHAHLAGHRRPGRGRAHERLRPVDGDDRRDPARVPDPQLLPRRPRRARAEGRRPQPLGGHRALGVRARARVHHAVQPVHLGAPQRTTDAILRLVGVDPRGTERDVLSEAELRMLVSRSTAAGRDRAGRAADDRQGLRLRRQGRGGRDGRAAGRRGALGRAVAAGGAGDGARLAVHALPRLPRHARRHDRRAARPRPLLRGRGAGARARRGEHRGAAAARLHRPGDEGPRLAPPGVPPPEQPLRHRRRRVRRDGRDLHARGPARGDRRRDRGRVRRPGGAGRAGRRGHLPDRRHVPDRRVQRAVRHRSPRRGLPHARRLRLRPARARARARATTSPTTGSASTCSRWRATGSSGCRSPSSSGRGCARRRRTCSTTTTRSNSSRYPGAARKGSRHSSKQEHHEPHRHARGRGSRRARHRRRVRRRRDAEADRHRGRPAQDLAHAERQEGDPSEGGRLRDHRPGHRLRPRLPPHRPGRRTRRRRSAARASTGGTSSWPRAPTRTSATPTRAS